MVADPIEPAFLPGQRQPAFSLLWHLVPKLIPAHSIPEAWRSVGGARKCDFIDVVRASMHRMLATGMEA